MPDNAPRDAALRAENRWMLTIDFNRSKYGRHLLADACEIRSIPGFITSPQHHRLRFYEIALITDGSGLLDLDGTPLEVAPYRLCLTAPGEIRSWQVAGARLDGWLLFFEPEFINEFFADPCFVESLPIFSASAGQRSFALPKKAFDELAGIVCAMQEELHSVQVDSCHLLRAQTYLLLVSMQRHCSRSIEAVDQTIRLSRQFTRLVNEHYLRCERVAYYADLLEVTPRHLNQCVKDATGLGARETIHKRIHLEARRLLLKTDLSVLQIAQSLHFEDPSYFSRFFKRLAGVTPNAFRAQHGSPIFPALRPLSESD